MQINLCPVLQPNPSKIPNYWKADYDAIQNYIQSIELNQNTSKYENFKWVFRESRSFVPDKAVSNKSDKPWITKRHKSLLNNKRRLWHKYRQTRDPVDSSLNAFLDISIGL